MEKTEITTAFEVLETTVTVVEIDEIQETTAVQSSDLSNIDVDMLNTFTYLGSAFVLAFFFFFVCKGVYRLFNMFF